MTSDSDYCIYICRSQLVGELFYFAVVSKAFSPTKSVAHCVFSNVNLANSTVKLTGRHYGEYS
jgi:hypothetical protein